MAEGRRDSPAADRRRSAQPRAAAPAGVLLSARRRRPRRRAIASARCRRPIRRTRGSLFYLAESLNDLEEYAEAEKIFRKLLAADAERSRPPRPASRLSLVGQKKWDEASATFTKLLGRRRPARPPDRAGAHAARVHRSAEGQLRRGRSRPRSRSSSSATSRTRRRSTSPCEALQQAEEVPPTRSRCSSRSCRSSTTIRSSTRATSRRSSRAGQKEKARAARGAAGEARHAQHDRRRRGVRAAGDTAAAVALMKAAVAAKPDDVDLQFQLGSVLRARGRSARPRRQTFLAVLEKNRESRADAQLPRLHVGRERREPRSSARDADARRRPGAGQRRVRRFARLGVLPPRQSRARGEVPHRRDAPPAARCDGARAPRRRAREARRHAARAAGATAPRSTLDPESKDVDKLRSKIAEIERKDRDLAAMSR